MCKRRSSVANKKRTKNKINGFARAFTMALQHPSHFYPNAFDFQFVSTPFAQMNFSCCISLEPFNALFISSSHHLALSRSTSFRFLCNFLCVVCSFYLLVTDAKNFHANVPWTTSFSIWLLFPRCVLWMKRIFSSKYKFIFDYRKKNDIDDNYVHGCHQWYDQTNASECEILQKLRRKLTKQERKLKKNDAKKEKKRKTLTV